MKSKILTLFAAVCLMATGCKKDENGNTLLDNLLNLGYNGQDNVSEVPSSVTPSEYYGGDLPASVDLESKFPPTGDQGQYGTCVAWAVAYNYKTAIDGITRNLTASQLASAGNQFSPKDLFVALPDNQKGSDCGGTNFSFALELAQSRGIAHMSTVPYTNLGNCSNAGLDPNWTADANQSKIKSWRKIAATVNDIKQSLASDIPVILGAKLADNFMDYTGGSVITSASGYNRVGQHAYHAMVIAGYDDSKGPGGAFKILNSWGDSWGESGNVWIDYNFFINEFCKDGSGESPLFTAVSDGGTNPPDTDPPTNITGVDMAPWAFSDIPVSGVSRQIDFNVYNIGNQAASPASDWSVYYIYYDAYNANNYDFVFYDRFNTSIAQNTYECTGNNCILNLAIPGGSSLAYEGFGTESVYQNYDMPTNVTGQYYLLLIADAFDDFAEQDEQNNLFYTTDYPITFQNGIEQKGGNSFSFENQERPTTSSLKKSQFNTSIRPDNLNAYRPDEIFQLLKKEKKSGRFAQKLAQFKKQHGITNIQANPARK